MIRPYGGIKPQIHPTAFVEESALIIGDVQIGEQSSIWFGTVARGDVYTIRIGARTNIQDLSVLHSRSAQEALVIGDDVTVGHNAVLHACRIGDRCLIGMGSIVLDGAEVGEEAIVAAGSVVRAGQKIPSRVLVAGVPAEVKRPLTEAEVAEILASAKRYVHLAESYRAA